MKLNEKITQILDIFRNTNTSFSEIEKGVVNLSMEDKNIVYKCMTLHENKKVRKYAINSLELEILWMLVSFEKFPMYSTYEIAKKIFEKDNTDYQKVIFDLKYNDIKRQIAKKGELKYFPYYENYILLFKNSAVILEDSYFERLKELVIEIYKVNPTGVSQKFSEIYKAINLDVISDKTTAKGPGETIFNTLPFITKEKLISNMLYFRYFITSTDDDLALITLKMIKSSEFASEILKVKNINGKLFRTIANSNELMSSYNAKRSLLFNPKAIVEYYRKYKSFLRSYDLKALSKSYDVNQQIKQLAKRDFNRKRL